MHIIRLRHPWQAAWRDQPTDDAIAPSRVHTAQQLRPAHYSRQFHRPSGLREHQSVALIVQPLGSVSLAMQPNDSPPLPTLTAHTKAAANDTKLNCIEAACSVVLHAVLLNSQPLSLSAAINDAELITHIAARIDAMLAPFNQLEIVCSIAASETIDDETAAVQIIDSFAASPPALAQWAEVRLEIDD